jgi:hypothetical protein
MDRLNPGGAGRVVVRLSEVDQHLREKVAEEIIRRGRLSGLDAVAFAFAASHPAHDPEIEVDGEKAFRVLVERKQPRGQGVRVWEW